jgi:hypothetical protein
MEPAPRVPMLTLPWRVVLLTCLARPPSAFVFHRGLPALCAFEKASPTPHGAAASWRHLWSDGDAVC